MPTPIHRHDVERLAAQGAQLVEVLPADEYEEMHLPGALHLPLRQLSYGAATERLEPGRPVIVYCWDSLCDMSPRAAWRLEALGFHEVYDYTAGKADWLAAGLPIDGPGSGTTRVVDAIDRDVPTCHPSEALAEVAARTRSAGWDLCVVVNERRIVQGRLRLDRIDATSPDVVETMMELGPTTVRADAELASTTERMQQRGATSLLVTTPDGALLGALSLRAR
ncbi:MAG: rhodanese-like domain-containing protein [Acidimicrobiia bacterium]